MKRLIYQVCLGEAQKSRLYETCINSVENYCAEHKIDHFVQGLPKLRIKPDPFSSNRSKDSYGKHGGYLPIYEKENALDLLDQYDQIAIVDADIYIREGAPNIFNDFEEPYAFGAVCEREMDITPEYVAKIKNYSHMQYANLHNKGIGFHPDDRGFEFFNMGMILINSKRFAPFMNGQTAKQFIGRLEFKDCVDGVGAWKWSTDQTLLNYFLKKYKVPTQHLDDKWNGLYTAHRSIEDCHFIHFFLKDKLPQSGENIEELIGTL